MCRTRSPPDRRHVCQAAPAPPPDGVRGHGSPRYRSPAGAGPHQAAGPGHPPRPPAVRMTEALQSRLRSATGYGHRRRPLRNRDWRAAPATRYPSHPQRLLRPRPQHHTAAGSTTPTATTGCKPSKTRHPAPARTEPATATSSSVSTADVPSDAGGPLTGTAAAAYAACRIRLIERCRVHVEPPEIRADLPDLVAPSMSGDCRAARPAGRGTLAARRPGVPCAACCYAWLAFGD